MALTKEQEMWINDLDNEPGAVNRVTSSVLRILQQHGVLSKKNMAVNEDELWLEVEKSIRDAKNWDGFENLAVLAARGILRRELELART